MTRIVVVLLLVAVAALTAAACSANGGNAPDAASASATEAISALVQSAAGKADSEASRSAEAAVDAAEERQTEQEEAHAAPSGGELKLTDPEPRLWDSILVRVPCRRTPSQLWFITAGRFGLHSWPQSRFDFAPGSLKRILPSAGAGAVSP